MTKDLTAVVSAVAVVLLGALGRLGQPLVKHHLSRRRERLRQRDSLVSELRPLMDEAFRAVTTLAAAWQRPDPQAEIANAQSRVEALRTCFRKAKPFLPAHVRATVYRFVVNSGALVILFSTQHKGPDPHLAWIEIGKCYRELKPCPKAFEQQIQRMQQTYLARLVAWVRPAVRRGKKPAP